MMVSRVWNNHVFTRYPNHWRTQHPRNVAKHEEWRELSTRLRLSIGVASILREPIDAERACHLANYLFNGGWSPARAK
jgi:hypothetical protein